MKTTKHSSIEYTSIKLFIHRLRIFYHVLVLGDAVDKMKLPQEGSGEDTVEESSAREGMIVESIDDLPNHR